AFLLLNSSVKVAPSNEFSTALGRNWSWYGWPGTTKELTPVALSSRTPRGVSTTRASGVGIADGPTLKAWTVMRNRPFLSFFIFPGRKATWSKPTRPAPSTVGVGIPPVPPVPPPPPDWALTVKTAEKPLAGCSDWPPWSCGEADPPTVSFPVATGAPGRLIRQTVPAGMPAEELTSVNVSPVMGPPGPVTLTAEACPGRLTPVAVPPNVIVIED